MDDGRAEQLIGDLRRDVMLQLDKMANQIATATQIATTAQTQIISHVSVCDERQRRLEDRQNERRRWEEDRTTEWRDFMKDSSEDRAKINDSIHRTRDELQGLWIKILLAVIGANAVGAGATAAFLKAGVANNILH